MVWTFDLEPVPRGRAMSLLEVNQLKFSWIIYRNFLHAEIRIELIQHSLISHRYGKLVFIDLCMYRNFTHMVFYINKSFLEGTSSIVFAKNFVK